MNPGENPSAEALADQRTARQVLAQVMEELQRMLHPLMPHLSEELWHALTGTDDGTYLALQSWPELNEAALDEALERSFTELFEAIRVVRNLRAVAGLKPSQAAPVRFITTRSDLAESLTRASVDIAALTRAESVEVLADARPAAPWLASVVSCRCCCPSMAWWILMPSKAACRKISPRRRRRSLGCKSGSTIPTSPIKPQPLWWLSAAPTWPRPKPKPSWPANAWLI